MEPDSLSSSSGDPRSGSSGSGSHRRRSRSRRHRRKQSSRSGLWSGVRQRIGKFYKRNKSWLLVLLAAIALIGLLLLTFMEVEREAVNRVHGNTF